MATKSILLLSGGLDSTVAAALSLRQAKPLLALTVNYGQKAFKAEQEAAAYFANSWSCEHTIVDLSWLGKLSTNALTDPAITPLWMDLDDEKTSIASASRAWVPARNLVLTAVAAAYADARDADIIVAGWNSEEACNFPDNSIKFASALNRTLNVCCHHPLNLFLPLLGMDKTQIYGQALKLKINVFKTYSCWGAGPSPCGVCESCLRLIRAKSLNQPQSS